MAQLTKVAVPRPCFDELMAALKRSASLVDEDDGKEAILFLREGLEIVPEAPPVKMPPHECPPLHGPMGDDSELPR